MTLFNYTRYKGTSLNIATPPPKPIVHVSSRRTYITLVVHISKTEPQTWKRNFVSISITQICRMINLTFIPLVLYHLSIASRRRGYLVTRSLHSCQHFYFSNLHDILNQRYYAHRLDFSEWFMNFSECLWTGTNLASTIDLVHAG